jgi:hypothetical protein
MQLHVRGADKPLLQLGNVVWIGLEGVDEGPRCGQFCADVTPVRTAIDNHVAGPQHRDDPKHQPFGFGDLKLAHVTALQLLQRLFIKDHRINP